MNKNRIVYILFTVLIMFSFVGYVKADNKVSDNNYTYKFYFSTYKNDGLNLIIDALCDDSEGKELGTCGLCIPNSDGKCDGNGKLLDSERFYSPVRDGSYTPLEDENNSYLLFLKKNGIQDSEITTRIQNTRPLCDDYKKKTSSSIYKICNGSTTSGTTTSTNGTCTYKFYKYKGDEKDGLYEMTIVPDDSGDCNINVSYNSTLQIATFKDKRLMLFGGNVLYFYGKNSSDNVCTKVTPTYCPKLTVCSDPIPGNAYNYYIELDNSSCNGYTGPTQTTENGAGASSSSDSTSEWKDVSITEYQNMTCEEILGGKDSDIINLLQLIVNVVKVAVPILLIVFGTLDFGKAIFVSDEGEMKKSQSKFIKRLIIAVAFFLVPIILKLILGIADNIWGNIDTTFCGIDF